MFTKKWIISIVSTVIVKEERVIAGISYSKRLQLSGWDYIDFAMRQTSVQVPTLPM